MSHFFGAAFRPFFLAALSFGLVVIALWVPVFDGHIALGGPFSPIDWHVHEMVFGYTSVVIAGFLFTAIPNWTGRDPVHGGTLIALSILWILGRVVVAGPGGFGWISAMLVDCAFTGLVSAIAIREIVGGKNWRNLIVAAPVTGFFAANVFYHLEAGITGGADIGRRLGLALVVTLILLIGGRIIPVFTRNWLIRNNPGPLPVAMNRFDVVSLAMAVPVLGAWSFWPTAQATETLLLGFGFLHFLRLSRWCGQRTIASPLLLMLHLAYGFLPLGFLALGFGSDTAGFHLLGIGGIGCMTVAVMMRASLGHSGGALIADRGMIAGFSLLLIAAVIRSYTPGLEIGPYTGIHLAAACWSLAYGLVLWRLVPVFFAVAES